MYYGDNTRTLPFEMSIRSTIFTANHRKINACVKNWKYFCTWYSIQWLTYSFIHVYIISHVLNIVYKLLDKKNLILYMYINLFILHCEWRFLLNLHLTRKLLLGVHLILWFQYHLWKQLVFIYFPELPLSKPVLIRVRTWIPIVNMFPINSFYCHFK